LFTRIEWANPHVYFYLDVKDEKAPAQTGDANYKPGPPPARLESEIPLKVGDQVIVDVPGEGRL